MIPTDNKKHKRSSAKTGLNPVLALVMIPTTEDGRIVNMTEVSLNPVLALVMIPTLVDQNMTAGNYNSLNPVLALVMIPTQIVAVVLCVLPLMSQSSISPGYDSYHVIQWVMDTLVFMVSIQY